MSLTERLHRRIATQGPITLADYMTACLLDPAEGVAPGQAAVVYDRSRVVGSATIEATRRVTAGSR